MVTTTIKALIGHQFLKLMRVCADVTGWSFGLVSGEKSYLLMMRIENDIGVIFDTNVFPDEIKPFVVTANYHNERARNMGCKGLLSPTQLYRLHTIQNGICAYSKKESKSLHLEHIKPLALGGENVIWNVVYIDSKLNTSKGKKTLKEWSKKKGFDCSVIEQNIAEIHKNF